MSLFQGQYGSSSADDTPMAMETDPDNPLTRVDAHQSPPPWDPLHVRLPGVSRDMSLRSQSRERRHAALSVLTDRELLTQHALASHESIPQTRRRFLHNFIGIPGPDTYAISITEKKPSQNLRETLRTQALADSNAPSSSSNPEPSHRTSEPFQISRVPSGRQEYGEKPVTFVIENEGGWMTKAEVESAAKKKKARISSGTVEAGPSGSPRTAVGSPRRGRGRG